jgi:hypothetical protein
VEHGVKYRPGDRGAVSWVRKAIGRGELHPATGRPDDEHVTDVAARWRRQLEIDEHLQTTGSDHVTARFVARKARFVNQGDVCPSPSEHQGRHAASWAATDDKHVKVQAHAPPFVASDLQ